MPVTRLSLHDRHEPPSEYPSSEEQIFEQTEGSVPTQSNPHSVRQVLVQPSPFIRFPSSHISQVSTMPSPQTQGIPVNEHVVSGFVDEYGAEFDEGPHVHPSSLMQLSHPVPGPFPTPRSHFSVPTVIPSPQVVEQPLSPAVEEQGHVHPGDSPVHPGQLTLSHTSVPTQIPSPQVVVQVLAPGVTEQGQFHPGDAPVQPGQSALSQTSVPTQIPSPQIGAHD